MATPVKEIYITGVIDSHQAGELKTVVGRIKHVPAKNAIWASDLKLKSIHAFNIVNHNASSGTILSARVVPIPSIGAAYGSLPTRNNYASVVARGIGGTYVVNPVLTAGTFGYSFVAYGE